jgi:hypothetical protein
MTTYKNASDHDTNVTALPSGMAADFLVPGAAASSMAQMPELLTNGCLDVGFCGETVDKIRVNQHRA